MVLLLLMGMVSAPPWGTEIRTSPPSPPRLALQGAQPAGTVVWVKRKLKVTVQGPGSFVLDFYGLQAVRGRRTQGPGQVVVKHSFRQNGKSEKRQHRVALPGQTLAGASVKQRTWRLTEPRSLTLELGPGKHQLAISIKGAPVGVAVVARREVGVGPAAPEDAPQLPPEPSLAELAPPDAEPEPALPEPGGELALEPPERSGPAVATPEPSLPEPHGEEPTLAGADAAAEPELPGVAEGAPEPSLVGGAVRGAAGPAFELMSEVETVDVVEPDAVIVFNRVEVGQNLRLRAKGPGTVVFDVHTYRDPAQPGSLDPVTVNVLVNEATAQTRSIAQASDERFQLLGTGHALSERVTLRVPVPAGEHDVAVSVSDGAVLGALIRPRFENVVDEPKVASAPVAAPAVVAPAPPLPPEVESSSRLALLAGGTLVMALGTVGYGASLAGDYGFTLGRQHFGAGASAGIGQVHVERTVRDPRLDPNPVGVNLTLTMIPAVAVVRWSYSFTDWLDLTLGVGGGAWVGWLQTQAPGVDRMSRTQLAALGHAEVTLLFRLALGGVALRFAYQPATNVQTRHITPFSPSTLSLAAGWMFEM